MKNRKGFTLVELLAVIVILGVLLLIAVPGAQTIIKNSRKKAFESAAKLAIESVETVKSLEDASSLFATGANSCYIKLSSITLDRGSFGENHNGYVYVHTNSLGAIVVNISYANNEFYVSDGTLTAMNAQDQGNPKENYNTTPLGVDACTWYAD